MTGWELAVIAAVAFAQEPAPEPPVPTATPTPVPTESPTAGVGASDRSTTPKRAGGPRRRATSRPMSSPARVTLKAMRLTVSATAAKVAASPGTSVE